MKLSKLYTYLYSNIVTIIEAEIIQNDFLNFVNFFNNQILVNKSDNGLINITNTTLYQLRANKREEILIVHINHDL